MENSRMQKREHVYEILNNTDDGSENDVFWWNPDKKKIESNSAFALEGLKRNHFSIGMLTFDDGPDYLDALPLVYKSGYMQAVRIG